MSGQALLPESWASRPMASAESDAATPVPVGRREIARALEFASAGSDAEALAFALDQANRAGVSPDVLSRARKRKAALDGEASGSSSRRVRLDAEAALASAAGTGSADLLEAALRQAADAGVSGEAWDHALARQEELEVESMQSQAQQQALGAMRLARQNMDLPGLLLAVKRCNEVGADPARMRQEALGAPTPRVGEQRHGMAACILRFAVQGSDLEVLDFAIEWARTEDVAEAELEAACRRRAELEVDRGAEGAVAEAAAALAAAWTAPDPEALAAALARAREAGVSPHMLGLAETRLDALRGRAGAAPAPPARRPRPSRTPAAPAAPAAPAIDPAEMERRQQQCREATAALKTAMVRGGAGPLADAIQQAEDAGVKRELVAPARRKLARLVKPDDGV